MKRLIISADDFGLTPSVNRGIAMAVKEGIVASVNLIPSGDAFEDAVNLARNLNLNEAGAHISLTETLPTAGSDKVPSLISGDGRFCSNRNVLFLKLLTNSIRYHHITAEIESQIAAIEKRGFRITNLSSHEHIHMLPKLRDIFIRLAKEHGIPSIRYVNDESLGYRLSPARIFRHVAMSGFVKPMKMALAKFSVAHNDRLLGFLDSGRITEERLLGLLKLLKDGVTELVTHPGFIGPEVLNKYKFHSNCEAELFGLTSPRVKKLIESEGIKLISYAAFSN